VTEGLRFAMIPVYILSIGVFMFSVIRIFYSPKKQHKILRGFGISVFCLLFSISIALPAFLPVIDLPKPSGKSAVGTMTMDFIEPSRENLVTGTKSDQKIAVQIWYPASDTTGKVQTNWLNSRTAARFFADMERLPDLLGQLCFVKTNSYFNASLSDDSKQYPVILFSGGAGMFNGQNTIQMEELASQGYIVCAVSHPFEDFATVYSDGSIELLDMLSQDSAQALQSVKNQTSDESSPEFQREVMRQCHTITENVRIWSADMSFIADQLNLLDDGSISSIF
jgi:hypothetical protein